MKIKREVALSKWECLIEFDAVYDRLLFEEWWQTTGRAAFFEHKANNLPESDVDDEIKR